ncbi:MAG TPA: S26 family signal peptidase [Candidatus Eremiobacteraceae bacterium]|nr:S26 family signal peptidase [Candidatus Eremiobacteraceae bacterium]
MRTSSVLLGGAFGVLAVAVSAWVKPDIRLVYNPTQSAPRGWYVVHPAAQLAVGDYVIAQLPRDIAAFAAKRRYLPRHVPVLKRIAATTGQRVCVRDGTVLIDGAAVATTLAIDGKRRSLSAWSHCRKLELGELFLLNARAP